MWLTSSMNFLLYIKNLNSIKYKVERCKEEITQHFSIQEIQATW